MNLIVVDIQPFYLSCMGRNLLLETAKAIKVAETVFYYFNGDEVGIDDNPDSIRSMFFDYLSEDDFDKIQFIGKSYGFLRDWMDSGEEEETILDVLKQVEEADVSDSRGLEGYEYRDPIYIPHFDIPNIDFAHICGGGDQQCLWEMEILLKHREVKTKRLPSAIY